MSKVLLELQKGLHFRSEDADKTFRHGAMAELSHVADARLSECNEKLLQAYDVPKCRQRSSAMFPGRLGE